MTNDPPTIDGIPIRSESIGFSPAELIACGKCVRSNPPNRLNCFYCGELLELPAEIAAGISFKPVEVDDWEPGVNIIVTDGVARTNAQSIASAVAMDGDLAESVARLVPPFPIFRVRAEEAGEVSARLERLGLAVKRVEDSSLVPSKPAVRLKGVAFGADSLTFYPFNSEAVVVARTSEVVLIVVGAIVTTTAESKLKKKRKEMKEFDEHLSTSDHSVIDIYTASDETGFRVLPHGFDFSCLGERKSLIAAENVKVLSDKLRELIPGAAFDRSYANKLEILDKVWPRTVANTSKGIERNWFGVQRALGSTTTNEDQFTRYSRMRRKLI